MKAYVIATGTIKDEAVTFTDPGGAPLFRVMPDDNGLTSGETDRSVIVGRVSARSYEPRTRPHALTFWTPP